MRVNVVCEITKEEVEYYKNLWETEGTEEVVDTLESFLCEDILVREDFFDDMDFSVKVLDK